MIASAMIASAMRVRGFTLIEVLISVMILALGYLSFTSLQVYTTKSNQSALQRSQSVILANFMLESMRANKLSANAGYYDFGASDEEDIPVCSVPPGSDLPAHDKQAWMRALKENLGDKNSTCGFIACASNVCRVKIFWDDGRAGGSEDHFIEVVGEL